MNNNLLQIKIKQRLNKLSSDDYDSIEAWQMIEAFNKAQLEFCRKQIHGNNQRREGDESTKMLIDDMQILLTSSALTAGKYDVYYRTETLPVNYLYFKRITAKSKSACCGPRAMKINLQEMADVDSLLYDELNKPSAVWGETFATLSGNCANIYTNGEFDIQDIVLHYYRKPVEIEILGAVNPSTDEVFNTDVECEFKDDIVELIIEETAAILAKDLEMFNIMSTSQNNATKNN